MNKKLAAKPCSLVKTLRAKATLRNRYYYYNTLPNYITRAQTFKQFKESLQLYMNN